MTRRGGYGLAPTDVPLLFLLLSAGLAVGPAHITTACWPGFAVIAAGVAASLVLSRAPCVGRAWQIAAGATIGSGTLLAAYFVAQYGHLGYGEKLAPLDLAAGWMSRLIPPLGTWAPDRNSLGTALEGVLFLALGLALSAKRRPGRLVWGAAALVMATAVVFSASRGAWLGVAVAGLVWFVIERPWCAARAGSVPIAAALPLVAGLAWLVAVIWWPEATGAGAIAPALDRPDRVTLYRQSAQLIADYRVSGIGLGGPFAMLLSKYVLLIQVPFLTYSHNLYLESWLQLGLPGIMAVAWLGGVFLASLAALTQLRQRTAAQAAGLGPLAMLVHGVVDARQYVDAWTAAPLFVLLGLYASSIAPALTAPMKRRLLGWSLAAPAGLLAVTAAVSWPPGAAWQANLGALRQARAEIGTREDSAPQARELAAAEAHFRAALAAAPGERTASFRLALIEMADGRYDAAVGHAAAAWTADPASLARRKALGLALVWTGDLERAHGLLRTVPGMVEELNNWGSWRAGRHEKGLAIRAYRTSLLLAPEQPAVREEILRLERRAESAGGSRQAPGEAS